MNFLRSLFGGGENSAQLAKRRLQVVLVQDHLAMAPGTMEAIKAEIMEVISRHLEIDPEGIQIAVERRGHGDELVANIPVRRNVGTTRGGAPIPVARPPAPVRPARAGVPGARAAARRHR